jgi:hypothetical protein
VGRSATNAVAGGRRGCCRTDATPRRAVCGGRGSTDARGWGTDRCRGGSAAESCRCDWGFPGGAMMRGDVQERAPPRRTARGQSGRGWQGAPSPIPDYEAR